MHHGAFYLFHFTCFCSILVSGIRAGFSRSLSRLLFTVFAVKSKTLLLFLKEIFIYFWIIFLFLLLHQNDYHKLWNIIIVGYCTTSDFQTKIALDSRISPKIRESIIPSVLNVKTFRTHVHTTLLLQNITRTFIIFL